MAKSKRQIWVIDAGHGGHDVGCEGTKINEKEINLSVALRVAELVRTNLTDVKVMMTRSNDSFLTLERRASLANEAGADLFLSIHVNACPDANNVRGTETYYGPIGATSNPSVEEARKRNIQQSELLAWEMQKQYGLAGRPINRGIKRERYYVILYTRMPSILTEVGFISTPSEQDYMMSKKGQEEIAQCIYKGLKEYQETVQAGRVKRLLAQMRRTGGHATCVQPQTVELASAGSEATPSTTSSSNASVQAKASVTDAVAALMKRADNKGGEAKNSNQKTKKSKSTEQKQIGETTLAVSTSVTPTVADVPDPKLEPEMDNGELSFSIQIFSLKKKLKEGDTRFKGLKNIKITEKDNMYKYLYGTTSDYDEARKTLAEVRQLFPDAFLLAFLGNRPISTSDAQEMYIKKK